MAIKKLNLDKTIFEIKRKLKAHIGSNGNAHLPVSDDVNGFMTSKEHKQLEQIFENRKFIDGANIYTLPNGAYAGINMLNHPIYPDGVTSAGWYCFIDVTSSIEGNGRKLITVHDSINGARYHRVVDKSGDGDTGTKYWIKDVSEIVLWSGNSALDNPVTLTADIKNGDVNNFDSIYALFATSTGNINRSYGTISGGITINALNNAGSGFSINAFEAVIQFPNNNTAQITGNNQLNIYANGDKQQAYMSQLTSGIKILKIVGVK